ncbi:hypothetical protein C8J57DRAFT_1227032 [Mycena rebaudengoi]|nr:hypothetical protein C8J57DRAFT_1227032 [Mycena rebaudengoi]
MDREYCVAPNCSETFGGTVRHAWDGPRNHFFASGTKWLAQAILPDAIKTGVDTACDESRSYPTVLTDLFIRLMVRLNSQPPLLLDGLSHISRGQFWFGSTVMRSIDGNGVLQTQW